MNILKQLAGMFTPKSGPQGGDPGLYYYIKCSRCGEVIRVRINPMADLTVENDGTRFVRKMIVGKRCYNRIEGEFRFNSGRKLIESVISGGEMVSEDEYDAQQETPTE
jgi:hypothetical protein